MALLRAKWFTLKSYENEPFAAWDARVVNLAKEANLKAMLSVPGAMLGFKLVTGLTGKVIIEKSRGGRYLWNRN